ncbi:tetratricopeptide repeat protein [Desulforhabdus amnigena]|nr:tetratricopeptide repeat protein [Desulforhabdus amnigena]NLJ27998.1 tetratricopeptide repeat protein [Deltaproteobacteria bacterium]
MADIRQMLAGMRAKTVGKRRNYSGKLFPHLTICFGLLLLAALFPAHEGYPESARSLTADGNALYSAGKYDEALKAYEQAARERPEAGEIFFNKGNAYFQKGEYEKAKEAYEAAAIHTRDPSLEARSQFNLGNTAFLQGSRKLQSDPKEALGLYELSIRHYQNALKIDPKFEDAAENIEIARLKLKDLMDQIEKQKEAAKEREKLQKEMMQQLQEAVQEQESEIKDNQSLRGKKAQNPTQNFGKEHERLSERQRKTMEKTGEVAQKLSELQPQDTSSGRKAQEQSVQEHLKKAMEAQKTAAEEIGNQKLDSAQSEQEKALEQMKEAQSKLQDSRQESESKSKPGQNEENKGDKGSQTQSDQEKNQGQGSSQPESPQQPEQQQTRAGEQQKSPASLREGKEQPEDLRNGRAVIQEQAQDILQEEKENRLLFQESHKGEYRAVEKDW